MITGHARQRIETRLVGIIRPGDVDKLDKFSRECEPGKHYLVLRKLDKVYLNCDGSSGDSLVGVVQNGRIKTVMLRFEEQGYQWSDGKTWRIR